MQFLFDFLRHLSENNPLLLQSFGFFEFLEKHQDFNDVILDICSVG